MKGVSRGHEEGRQEGRLLTARASLQRVANARFGTALDDVLANVPDAALEEALVLVATAPDPASARARVEGLRP